MQGFKNWILNIYRNIPETKRWIVFGVAVSLIICIVAATVFFVFFRKPASSLPTGAPSEVVSPVSSEESSSEEASSAEPELLPLTVTSPTKQELTVTEPQILFSGTGDKSIPIYINDKEIERGEAGDFSVTLDLKQGKNTITLKYGEEVKTYTVTYRYVVIKSYNPSTAQTYSSGTRFAVNVEARADAKVTASFNGQTITLTKTKQSADDDTEHADDGTFANFTGSFKLPQDNITDIKLGKITFTATSGGVTEKFNSGNITVKKSSAIKSSDPAVTPQGGIYTDVGSGLIATVVSFNAETFNGDSADDMSRPTNNYLPEGTVDYCAEGLVTNGDNQYVLLRCGRRVYLTSNPGKSYETTVVTRTVGTLPETNQLALSEFTDEGRYTVLRLDTAWKAPFYFDILNQSYVNPDNQEYTFSQATFSYIDITFCYADELSGEFILPENNPIFSSAQVIKNKNDYTLRLYLKKTGAFYGWDSFYDEEGCLTFKFLNPVQIEEEGTLKGVRIYIDVGHGGSDGGASGSDYNYRESVLNLKLALKVKEKLEAKGATVIMSRTGDTYISPPERVKAFRAAEADYCISIHHDSSTKSSLNGFRPFHFTAFSRAAADYINTRTDNLTGVYLKDWDVACHYYYVTRMTFCPAVLTENGFMTNTTDHDNAKNDDVVDKKADAIVAGIQDYFDSIQN